MATQPVPDAGGRRHTLTAGVFVKRLLVGRHISSRRLHHTLLPKTLAVAVLAPDPLSSVAYSVESMVLVLVASTASAMHFAVPVTIGIAVLMLIVVASYRQTVRAYVTSGGAYVVAKHNLGVPAGLVAGAALVVDYVLTVAVSIASGVVAIVSAVPALHADTVWLALAFVGLLAVVNLRGVRESGLVLAGPTFAFIALLFAMIVTGFVRCIGGCPHAVVPTPVPTGLGAVGAFLLLKAFVSGSVGFTGVEAVSNAVTAFRRPQGKNAAQTLAFIGGVGISFILGVSWLAVHTGARPSSTVSLLSEVVRAVFPAPLFYLVQVLTFAMLVLAANTSFAGFPRLAAVLAEDRFFPRQFENLGDRLVYSNGILVLAALAALLIWAFQANVAKLIPLYLVGVFTAFTMSQAGMVRHWLRIRRQGGVAAAGWRRSIALNGAGAFATAVVAAITVVTTFAEGAWVVIVALPLLVLQFVAIHRHYAHVATRLHEGNVTLTEPTQAPVIIHVERLDEATARAVGYVRGFRRDEFRAVHVADAGRDPADLRERWKAFSRTSVELDVLPPTTHPADAVVDYVRGIRAETQGFVTVVIPEMFQKASIPLALRSRMAIRLKMKLLREPDVVTADVPVLLGEARAESSPTAHVPNRTDAIVLISSVNDATVRAINYARSLRAADVRAVFVALDPAEAAPIQRAWTDQRIPVTLDIVDAPFRELDQPILEEVRRVTKRPGAVAAVIIPEVVVSRWWQHILHGQRALFVKRLLLFEERVVLSSVPLRVDGREAPARGGNVSPGKRPRGLARAGA